MAGENDNDGSITLNVDDLETLQVEVDPAIAEEAEKTGAKTAKPEPKRTRRVSPELDDQGVVAPAATPQQVQQVATGPTPEEALAQAQAALKQQEEARKAAEATAASERARREAAEQAQRAALEQAEQQAQRASDTELTLIENNIVSAERELADQREAYIRAAEAGEFSKMADIQTKIAKAAAALDRWEDTKAGYERRQPAATPTTEGRVVAPDPSSPTEKFLAGFAPHAQTWLRQHLDCLPPQYGGSATKNNQMMQGHFAALSKGLTEGSQEYFQVIEETIGLRQPAQAAQPNQAVVEPAAPSATSKAAEVTPAGAPRAAPTPAAAPSRDAPSASGQTQPRTVREVRLTKDQQEMAKLSFPHLPEQQAFGMYARNLLELEAEGKIGRSTH